MELNTTLHLATRDKIDYLELVQNGDVVEHVRLDKWAEAGGKLPVVTFQQSGWMLVRAITNHEKTYRFAMSGPYYVRFDGPPRISRQSARFFMDWVHQRARQVQQANGPKRDEILRLYRQARDYWQNLADHANAE